MTYDQAHSKIKELATDDFLLRLVEIARCYGWSGDYVEIDYFVHDIFAYAEKDVPDLTPYILNND